MKTTLVVLGLGCAAMIGGLAFALFFAMALTSSDAAVRRLGQARWKRLHRFGAWYIWLIFTQTLAGSVLGGGLPIHVAALVAYLAAAALRLFVWQRNRRRMRELWPWRAESWSGSPGASRLSPYFS